jgi:hypothetical protein
MGLPNWSMKSKGRNFSESDFKKILQQEQSIKFQSSLLIY